jgi:hypothetical protein
MPDMTFETLLSRQLREYAEASVRPIDRFAIAEETIAAGRTMPRWRRSWGLASMPGSRFLVPLLIGLLLAALGGGALLVGSRLLAPPPLPMRHTYLNELLPAPDLPTPITATLVTLADDRVLVMGSDSMVGHGITALLYDPATGASVRAGPMVPPGQWVGPALLLRDGRVLVLGDGVAQLFDPATMRFEAVGPAVTPRSGGSAALLRDGRVLIAGGFPPGGTGGAVPALHSAELFDPVTMTSTPTGSTGTPTGGGPMVTLPDGRVFMATDPAAEIYDPATGTFGAASTTSPGGGGHPIVLPDGRVVLAGSTGLYDGGRIQVWDPASRTFSTRDLAEPLTGATLLDDGRVFLIGMCRGRSAGWTGVYDPATEVTTPTPGTRACRPASARLADGRVLIVGGVEPAVPTVEIFR